MIDWRVLADQAGRAVGTPCYVMAETPIQHAMQQLQTMESSIPLRHWLSLKSQPVAQLLHVALESGFGVDVVSEFELLSALSSGVPPERILVNGVGKHRWLAAHRLRGLNVHFDSTAEVRALAVLAKALDWCVGLRCAVPETSGCYNQFGMTADEVRSGAALLRSFGVAVRGLHFHLHTSVQSVDEYQRALAWVAEVARDACLTPEYLDVGGGLPIAGEWSMDGVCVAGAFDLDEFREWLGGIHAVLPSVQQVWLENGRFLSGPAGVLAVSVLDKKDRNDTTFLICDGGRVNHARMASMEKHEITLSPAREGPLRKTVVCGPTCADLDRLGCWMLPDSIEPGDRVLWLTAGAYHIPLETRFSTGLAPVVWFDVEQQLSIIRDRETAQEWWEQWRDASVRSPVQAYGGGSGRPA
jgi:diaminopimelate decarboxylase